MTSPHDPRDTADSPETPAKADLRQAVETAVRLAAGVPTHVRVEPYDRAVADFDAAGELLRRATTVQRARAAELLAHGGSPVDVGYALYLHASDPTERATEWLAMAPVLPDVTDDALVTDVVDSLVRVQAERVTRPAISAGTYAGSPLLDRVAELAAAGDVVQQLTARLRHSATEARGEGLLWGDLAVLLGVSPFAIDSTRADDAAGDVFDLLVPDGTLAWRCSGCDETIQDTRPVDGENQKAGHAADCAFVVADQAAKTELS